MKRNEAYSLQEIGGIPHLLPYGQNIADHRRGIQLNATGTFIWNALREDLCEEELMMLMKEHFQPSLQEIPQMKADLHAFLQQLIRLEILLPEPVPQPPYIKDFSKYIQIGGLLLHYLGLEEIFPEEFTSFTVDESDLAGISALHRDPDQTIYIVSTRPAHCIINRILLRSRDLDLFESDSCYLLHFHGNSGLTECRLTKDAARAYFYCLPPYNRDMAQALFHAIRFTYLVLAQKHDMFMLHSASLLYRDKAWLFSGSSGTGKSTHTALWHEQLHTPLLNGDLNLMELTSDGPVVHGTPWCGTSGIFTTKTFPLGGITLLKQHTEDTCEILEHGREILPVMQRLISPAWTEEMLKANLDFCTRLSEQIAVFRLQCTKTHTAVETVRRQIDQTYLE